MTRAERAEAAKRLRDLAHEIYDTLEEMEAVLAEVAPEELELAREARYITLEDTITILEEEV